MLVRKAFAGASLMSILAGFAACESFDEVPAVPVDDAGSSTPADSATADDGATANDSSTADVTTDAGMHCRGAFSTSPRFLATTAGKDVVSVRGTTPGNFFISWKTTSDDDIVSAKQGNTAIVFETPDLLAALPLGKPVNDNHATAPRDLSYVLFASDRAAPVDGGDAGVFRLWVSTFNGSFPAPSYVEMGPGLTPADAIEAPYVAGSRVYYTSKGVIRSGVLTSVLKNKLGTTPTPGVGDGARPVASDDELELFYQTGVGIQRAARNTLEEKFANAETIGGTGDYPTWITPDSCELWVIHTSGSGREVHIFDRTP